MKLRTVYQVRIAGRACADWGETLDRVKAEHTLEYAKANFDRPEPSVMLTSVEREVFEVGDQVFYCRGDEAWCGKVIEIREDELTLTAHVMSPEGAVMVCNASPSSNLLPGTGCEQIRLATPDEWRDAIHDASQKRELAIELG